MKKTTTLYQTENQRLRRFGAVSSGVGSPKELGTPGYKSLMQNLRAHLSASATVILPRTLLILAAGLFLKLAASTAVTVASETASRHVPDSADCIAVSYLKALGALESGNNDRARGRAGEVGRYQCLVSVWLGEVRPAFSILQATNPITAGAVTLRVVRGRTGRDVWQLSPAEFALAWHCPNARNLNREQRDYVARFVNIFNQFQLRISQINTNKTVNQ